MDSTRAGEGTKLEKYMRPFGENLKLLMSEKGVKAREVATALGLSSRTVNEWVGGGARTPRDLVQIKKLAEFFGCSVHRLLYGEEENLLERVLTKTDIHTGLYEISIRRVNK